MSVEDGIVDFGPLANLIGVWKGDKGVDLAPDSEIGTEKNPFYEEITCEGLGTYVTNGEEQNIAAIFYHQHVFRKSNDEEFHNQCGYFMWDAANKVIMHSLSIPRAMNLVAGATYNGETDKDGNVVFELKAGIDNPDWQISQSPYLQEKAKTTEFTYKATLGKDTFSYSELTLINIYGERDFRHVDTSKLTKVK